MIRSRHITVCLATGVLLSACGGASLTGDTTDTPLINAMSVVEALRAEEYASQTTGRRTDRPIFETPGITILVEGEPVDIYGFPTEGTALDEAAAVRAPDVEPLDTPLSLYHKDRVAAVYRGTTEHVNDALEDVLGWPLKERE